MLVWDVEQGRIIVIVVVVVVTAVVIVIIRVVVIIIIIIRLTVTNEHLVNEDFGMYNYLLLPIK